MTRRTRTSSAPELERWLGPVAGPALLEYLREARTPAGAPRYPDLEGQLAELIPPRFLSPPPSTADGTYFDVAKVDRFLRFCRKLRHVKGSRWAGRPFEPDLWQVVFVIAPLFGWLRPDGTRVYRTLWLEVPRKNGKSTLASAFALYLLMADGEEGAEVYAAAAGKDQARNVFDPSYYMARASAAILKRCGLHNITRQAISWRQRASSYKVISSVAHLKHGMNVSGAVIDEIHIHKTRDLIEAIETGVGSRMQPLIAFLTTAGVDDPDSVYTERHDYAEKVARGDLEDPELLVVIYTIDEGDDPFVESTWRKANPGYGTSLQPSYIASAARKAKAAPAALNAFLRLHLNVRTGQVTRWLSIEKWDRSGGRWLTPELEELAGRTAYAGLDLASSVDLAALAVVLPRWEPDPDDDDQEIEVLDVIIRAWTPADTLAERARRDRAPYERWKKAKLLTATPGDVIDYDDIELEAFDLADLLELRRLHFDRWGSKQLVQHLKDGGLRVFDMGQGFASMSPAMKEAERLVLEGRIAHGGNELLRWAVQSLAVRQDPAGNIKPDREKSTGRIDPFVALVMAIDAYTRERGGGSVYEDRGLEVV